MFNSASSTIKRALINAVPRAVHSWITMYKSILVPSDGSKRAEAILPHAEQLAQLCSVKITLLQI